MRRTENQARERQRDRRTRGGRGWCRPCNRFSRSDSLSLSEAVLRCTPGVDPANQLRAALPCEPDKDHLSPGANPRPSFVSRSQDWPSTSQELLRANQLLSYTKPGSLPSLQIAVSCGQTLFVITIIIYPFVVGLV